MSTPNELTVRVALASTLGAGLDRDTRAVQRFTDRSSGMFSRMRGEMRALNAELTGFGAVTRLAGAAGLLYKAREAAINSARLDKDLGRIGRTAQMSAAEVGVLRKELWKMAEQTGQNRDELQAGFDKAVQAGLSFREAIPVIDSVNKGMAVTHASAVTLTDALRTASTTFDFDLAKPNEALRILDKMAVAADLGNAELESLAAIFATVGVNARRANMEFDSTLAFVETLSQLQGNPEKLATLAESTLRVFTTLNYMKDAQKATGVRFFDQNNARRNAVDVLRDIEKKFATLPDEKAKELFLGRAFGKADKDTMTGMVTLFSGDRMSKLAEAASKIERATGHIESKLPESIDNAIDQAGRLQSVMGRAADAFITPINKYATVPLLEGIVDGDATTRAAIGAGAAGLAIAGRMAWKRRGGRGAAADALGELAGAAGAQRVFVTNWPGGMLSAADALKQKRDARGGPLFGDGASAGAAAGASRAARAWGGAKGALKYGAPMALVAGGFDLYDTYNDDSLTQGQKNVQYGSTIGGTGGGLAGAAAGAAAGALLGPIGAVIGGLLGGALGAWGGEKVGGEIVLRVQDDRVKVGGLKSENPDVPISVDTGAYMVAP